MKIIALVALALFAFLASTADCPHNLEVLCIDDINKAYPICEKAAHEKGADVPADLDCLKYFAQMDKDCWPCICWVAQINKWNIKGCWSSSINPSINHISFLQQPCFRGIRPNALKLANIHALLKARLHQTITNIKSMK